MRKLMRLVVVALVLIVSGTGCVTNTITNLTSSTQPRSANNQYRIEYTWDSTQQSLLPSTITPFVMVDFDSYPMRRVIHSTNRWETWVPVPAGQNELVYHFKVDFEYNSFGKPMRASKLSPEYKLIIR